MVENTVKAPAAAQKHKSSYPKRMSNQIAYALLVYTGLHIFMTMGAIKGEGRSILPYFALVFLVAAIIPACRMFEKRWNRLGEEAEGTPGLTTKWRRDCAVLWAIAIGLPVLLTALFTGLSSLT